MFIHAGSKGLSKAYINLNYPNLHKTNGMVINSYIRSGVGSETSSLCYHSGS